MSGCQVKLYHHVTFDILKGAGKTKSSTSIMSYISDLVNTTRRGGTHGFIFDDCPLSGHLSTSVITEISVWHSTHIIALKVGSGGRDAIYLFKS